MFLNCKNITNLTINADTIEDDAFYYCDSLQTLVIGDSVKSIGALAFAYCDSLKTVTVGKSVEKFDNDGFAWHNAFAHDYNIETLYYNATNISTDNYSEAFQNTTNLKTVVIGDNVEGLPDGFLSACRYLDTIISYAVNVPTVYENTFGGIAYNDVPRGIPVIVPCGSQQDYRTADYWGTFTNIQSKTYDTTMAMTVCYGDSVNNHIAITSGVIVDTLQSVEGCDSIVTINLTVLPVYSTTIYDSILFDEKGEDYYDTTVVVLQAVNGCDSTVTTITLNDYDNTIDTIINNITMQICEGESYLFDTISVNTSGLYSKTVNVNRYRDSIINLTLVVNPTFDTTINATICQGQSYTLNNFNTNNSGLHLQELLSVNGCDSIVRLNLDVQQGFDTMITVNVCSAGFPSGVFVQNLQSEGGCDSTVRITMIQSAAPEPDTIIVHDTINTTDTLLITQYDTVIVDNYDTITLFDTVIVDNYDTITLFDTVIVDNYDTVTLFDTITLTDTIYVNDTIVPCAKIYTYIYATINEGETYSAFGFNESSAGTYRDTLISEDGCDSIVVLNLSILSSIEDVSKSSSVLLYPNPANDKTRLTFSNIGKAKVELYDTQGRVLKAYDVNDNQRELIVDVNDLAQGSYMITIKTDRMRISKKLIVE